MTIKPHFLNNNLKNNKKTLLRLSKSLDKIWQKMNRETKRKKFLNSAAN
jgi:hypothetical protein